MELKNIIFIHRDYQQPVEFQRWVTSASQKYDAIIKIYNCVYDLCYLIDAEKLNKKYRLITIIDKQGIAPFLYLSKLGYVVASVYDEYSAYMTPFHNNTNVLTTGYEVCGANLMISIIEKFLETKFEGGRHLARIDMLNLEVASAIKH